MDRQNAAIKRVAVCDTQPLTAAGLASAVGGLEGFEFCAAFTSLGGLEEVLDGHRPDILVLDKGLGVQPILEWLGCRASRQTATVVWGTSLNEPEAIKLLQAGAKGILFKTAPIQTVLACLMAVAAGTTWMDEAVFGGHAAQEHGGRSELTPREIQVMQLVEQGLKNKEIGRELGIRPGTVKIHLKHIFEKTGVRGRYGLALNSLRERNSHAAQPAQEEG